MLSPENVKQINRTLTLLRELQGRPVHTFGEGKFTEACKVAEIVLFNVLIVARTWTETEISNGELGLEPETLLPE